MPASTRHHAVDPHARRPALTERPYSVPNPLLWLLTTAPACPPSLPPHTHTQDFEKVWAKHEKATTQEKDVLIFDLKFPVSGKPLLCFLFCGSSCRAF